MHVAGCAPMGCVEDRRATPVTLNLLEQAWLHDAHPWAIKTLDSAEDDALPHNYVGVLDHR
jgi:hypothetical protein